MIKNEPPASPKALSALSRRSLFKLSGLAAASAATPAAARSFGSGFTHGVASGEPSQTRVLLWSRFVGEQDTTIEWDVSETMDFARVVASGSVTAGASRDWCIKSFAEGLTPGAWYYYRFTAPDGSKSEVGRTRTLPEGETQRFRMAVFSCSNYGFGYFNAYAHAAEANDVDLAVHLGDYIYEYGAGTYPSSREAHPTRTLFPNSEIVALTDYRLRYATYRSDPDLRRIHQLLPMIAAWDDHESANDSWKGGAQNHQVETEGDWKMRKAVAKRAYREWMPVSDEPYAEYQIGDLATLLRLDTRLEGREEQFNIGDVIQGKRTPEEMGAALAAFREGAYRAKDRELLGAPQQAWLADRLMASRNAGTQWQVLVQQVLIGELYTAPQLADAVPDSAPDFIKRRVQASALAGRAGLPANMDAWDGYPAARERLFEASLAADANLISLAGDTHNAWGFELNHSGEKVGVEFATHSVSSPGLESYLGAIPPQDLARAVVGHNARLKYADTSQRGYMVVELTPESASAEFRFMAGIRQRSTRVAGAKRIVASAGSRELAI
ncbi:MAG: alkaline phosphatase D family protein [Altererythrobacter sp.]|nr:alkaline phosphatase D family protein [Altererythrobacter sp.]